VRPEQTQTPQASRAELAAALRENQSKRVALMDQATKTHDPARRARILVEVRRLGARAGELGTLLKEARS
jgi:hypothetical protein